MIEVFSALNGIRYLPIKVKNTYCTVLKKLINLPQLNIERFGQVVGSRSSAMRLLIEIDLRFRSDRIQ